MKNQIKFWYLSLIVLSAWAVYGCQKSKPEVPEVPLVITTDVTTVAQTTAASGGNITADNGGLVTARGVCWSLSANPTVEDSKTSDGTGTGIFTSSVTGLTAGKTYYLRAYATNEGGTGYGEVTSFVTLQNDQVADVEGNIYKTVVIGTQTWMAENLKTTKFNDGTAIPLVTDYSAWSTHFSPAYCWFKNDISNKSIYGALYNGYTVNKTTSNNKNVCPAGWHVPTDNEWHTLALFVDGGAVLDYQESLIAGGKLKETGTTHWESPNSGATNEFGFTALPGGCRYSTGDFNVAVGYITLFWSEAGTTNYTRYLAFDRIDLMRSNPNGETGYSVRCVKNN